MQATETRIRTRKEKAMETIRLKAETLFSDGYSVEPIADEPGCYFVDSPLRTDPKTGQQYRRCYRVDIPNDDCDCPAREFYGTCKHIKATLKAVENALRLVMPMIPIETINCLNETGELPGNEPGQMTKIEYPIPVQQPTITRGFESTEAFHRERARDF